jgi:hypothetical protein
MLKTIPGPTFKIDSAIPCGCRVSRDEDTQKLRLWYCPAHASAFELLEILRSNLTALDGVVEQAAAGKCDPSAAMDAAMRTRLAIRKATGGV